MGDRIDFHPRIKRELSGLDAYPCRTIFSEIAFVDLIETTIILYIKEVDGHLEGAGEAARIMSNHAPRS